jgi:Na+/melibiose symporter-like transporter
MWAVVCVVLFLITFATTRERVEATSEHKSTLGQDLADLVANRPWLVMFVLTLVHFTILSMRGGAFYNYYHYFADKTAMYDWLAKLGLTAPPVAAGSAAPGGILEFLGWIVHADRSNLADSNVADVTQSVINVIEKIVFIAMIMLSPKLSEAFGKKAIAVVGFALTTVAAGMFYYLSPTQVDRMVALTVLVAITYGPTIPLVWAMFADVADFGEWKTGRRTTGIIFATIGFALKAGLSLGAFVLLKLLAHYGYVANAEQSPETLQGIRLVSSLYPAIMFGVCTLLLMVYPIGKRLTLQIASELAERRKNVQPT